MRNSGYGKYLVKAYDTLNTEVEYDKWCDFYETCFEKFSDIKVKNVCEMACGTGNMAVELHKRGYSVTAFDISEEMLTAADKKANDAGISDIRFTLQDMRSFKVYTKAQAVICMLDSINCLNDSQGVGEAFESAYNVLEPNGIFIFDVNTKYKFENVYSDNAYILEDEKVVLAWQNFYNDKTKKCDMYLTFFFEEADGKYDRYDEHMKQKMYAMRTLEKLLKNVGFSIACKTKDFAFSPASENSDERIFFICKKESEQ